jgi:peptidyl-prolyl cis-trans isomerase C
VCSSDLETRFGYHIIKVTDHQDSQKVPLEEAKQAIMERLIAQKKQEVVRGYLQDLKDKATIVYADGFAPASVRPAPTAPAMN